MSRSVASLHEAARAASRPLLEQIQPDALAPIGPPSPSAREVLEEANAARLRVLADLPADRQRARAENASFLGRQWLRVLPTQKQLLFADPEATEALRSRLLVPTRPLDRPCTFCAATPTLGHEDVCRAASRRWISRHNQVARAFINALSSRADLEVEKEPRIDAETDLRADFSTLLGSSR